MTDKNILLIWDRMGDYHRARWQAMQEQSNGVVYAADLFASDNLYLWESTNTSENYFCFSVDTANGEKANSFVAQFRSFKRVIKTKHIDTVFIPGYQHFVYLLFILFAHFHKKRVVLFAESWYRSNAIVEFGKSLFLGLFVDHFFVSGQRAYDHFSANLNIPKVKIEPGYSVVDNSHFQQTSLITEQAQKILLCVARYATEKNLFTLVQAFGKSRISKTWTLLLVGEGPDKSLLESAISDQTNIKLTGWVTYDELPALYHSATCFILPSRFEPWGLVVNEAMSAGLPLILSEQCGCVPDLLSPDNGWSFDCNDSEKLVKILDDMGETDIDTLQAMGRESQRLIKEFSVETWADKANQICK